MGCRRLGSVVGVALTMALAGPLVPSTDATGRFASEREGTVAMAPTPQASGSISGTVRFDGTAPEPAVLQMAADPFCLSAHGGETVTAQNLVVNDNGTLRWVFVWLRSAGPIAGSGAAPMVELDQLACVYRPHVIGLQAGGTLKITNSDQTLHNVNVQAVNNPSFNVAQPIPGMSTERVFEVAEIMVPVKCDVHAWMQAYVGVVPHPYFAVTGDAGSFEIRDVPAGDYVVEAWHETLGTKVLDLTVTAGGAASADFTFGGDR